MSELTVEKLREAARHIYYVPTAPKAKKGRIERLMNRFGWFRETEIIVVDLVAFSGHTWWPMGTTKQNRPPVGNQ